MLTVMTYNVGAGLAAPLRLVDGLYVTNPYSMDLAARIRAKNLAAKAIAAYRARMRDARDAMDVILNGEAPTMPFLAASWPWMTTDRRDSRPGHHARDAGETPEVARVGIASDPRFVNVPVRATAPALPQPSRPREGRPRRLGQRHW
jgi:hypothetical protein